MTTVYDLYAALCRIAPPELQMDFDNAGFLVGHGDAEVKKALLSLDITGAVIEEAIASGADLIISHHPVIFRPLHSLTAEGEGAQVLRLAENHIAAICMHTNLDIVEGGVNDVLIERLGASCEGPLDVDGCGRIGTLPSAVPLDEFLLRCKTTLGVNAIRYVDAGRPVFRLAVMGGSGGDSLREACAKGADTYVTADVKYHQFLDAQKLGLNLIDADHFCTENPVIPVLRDRLALEFPAVDFRISSVHHQIISAC